MGRHRKVYVAYNIKCYRKGLEILPVTFEGFGGTTSEFNKLFRVNRVKPTDLSFLSTSW